MYDLTLSVLNLSHKLVVNLSVSIVSPTRPNVTSLFY